MMKHSLLLSMAASLMLAVGVSSASAQTLPAAETAPAAVIDTSNPTMEMLVAVYNNEQWIAAVDMADKLLSDNPDKIELMAIKAVSLSRLGNFADAEPILAKLAEREPNRADFAANLCYCQIEMKNKKAADTCMTAARKVGTDEKLFHTAGIQLEMEGRLNEAAEAYEIAYALDKSSVIFLTSATSIYFAQKNYKKALELTEVGIKNNLKSVFLYINAAVACNYLGDYDKAMQFADDGYALYKDPLLLYHKAQALFALHRYDEAEPILRDLLKNSGIGYERQRVLLARILMNKSCSDQDAAACNETDKAPACCQANRECLDLLLGIDETGISHLNDTDNYPMWLGIAQFLNGKLEDAEAGLSREAGKNISKPNAGVYAALAIVLWKFGSERDRAASFQYYRQAVSASLDFNDINRVRDLRGWPARAVDALAEVKSASENELKKSKSGCGCRAVVAPPSQGQTGIGILAVLGLIGAGVMRRKKL